MKAFVILILATSTVGRAQTGSLSPTGTPAAPQMQTQPASDALSLDLDYPELQVVPRATDRLNLEAQVEGERKWLGYWPMLTGSALLLYSAQAQRGQYNYSHSDSAEDVERDTNRAVNTATVISGGWLLAGIYWTLQEPYGQSLSLVKRIKGNDKRSEIYRERMAEEGLEGPAALSRKLNRLYMLTHGFASVWLMAMAPQEKAVYPFLASLATFLPWIFEGHHETVYEKHLEYKRKIYAPNSSIWPAFN